MYKTTTHSRNSIRRGTITVATVLTSAGLLSACAMFASHEEYADYRAVRQAETSRERQEATGNYVQNHPNGYWIAELSANQESSEEEIWAANSSSLEGLRFYLRVFPQGQYQSQATTRIAALESVQTHRQEETQHQEEVEQEREEAVRESRRTWVTQAVQFWVRTLMGIRNYGSPIGRVARANPDFSRAFGQSPQPICEPAFCIKRYGQTYYIPMPGATRLERRMDVYLRLKLDHGRVERAELLLPNKGFSRWYELEHRTLVTDEDPEQRQMAINWALERIQPILRELAQGAQMIDYIPEPIAALQAGTETQDGEQAPVAPEAGPAEPSAETTQSATEGTETVAGAETTEDEAAPETSMIDDLLSQASGSETGNPNPTEEAPAAEAPPEAAPEPETLVLPVGLLAFERGRTRVVVFAAGHDDYDLGYDGIFLERIRN